MEQIKAALTRKVGPFPGWAWAAIAAAGIWLVLPHLKGAASSSSTAGAATGTVTHTTGTSAGPVGPPGPAGPTGPPADAIVPGTDQPGVAAWYKIDPATFFCLPGYIWDGRTCVLKAVGGPSIGNRRAWLMSPHHPDLTKTVRYPQLVRAIGGPAAHTANVHKVAAQTGIHPARLLALNSHYRGLIRIV